MTTQDWSRIWTLEELVPAARAQGVAISTPALQLIQMVVAGQIDEGVVSGPKELAKLMAEVPAADIISLYIIKYGRRTLTVNRSVRLLSDLHDRWVAIRSSNM